MVFSLGSAFLCPSSFVPVYLSSSQHHLNAHMRRAIVVSAHGLNSTGLPVHGMSTLRSDFLRQP